MKSIAQKIGFAALYIDITRKGAIQTAEMTAIKIVLKEIHKKRRQKMCNIYRLSELCAVHQIQQRKSPNIKSDI